MAGGDETSDVAAGRISHRRRRPVTQEVSQENNSASGSTNSENGPATKKKKGRTRTQLKKPPNGVRIPIEPKSDCFFKGSDGIACQVTVLLKHEYPSIIKEKNNAGVVTKRHAFEWEDYCIVYPPNEETGEISETAAERVKQGFWSIYTLIDDTLEQRVDVDRVLENLARKQLRQMMYQARKDAVKYCYDIDEPISDSAACGRLLTRSQYVQGRLEWCKDAEAWESLSKYWCSDEYLTSRGRGKLSRESPLAEDIAQNKGGSRNFICTKDYIEKTYGPQQATSMNTYKFMKVGAKKYKESGSSSSIENPKAKKRLVRMTTRRVLKVHIQKIGRNVILIPQLCTLPVVVCLMDGLR